MKRFLLGFLGIISLLLLNFGDCASVQTSVYTYTGSIVSDIVKSSPYHAFRFGFPLYQSVTFSSSNVIIYLDSVTLNGNLLNFGSSNSNSDGLFLYRFGPVVMVQDFDNSNVSVNTSPYSSNTSLTLNTSYNDIVALWVSMGNVNTTSFSCSSSSPCEIVIKFHFSFDDSYYLYGVYDPNLSKCLSDINYLTGELDLLHQNLAQCQEDYATCDNDLYNCQNSSSCDYSGYILESEITTGYCETRFNLISPSDCPNSSGSGDIQRSSFWVNNFQVMGGRNIYLYIPDWLDWSYTYVDENLQVEVENEGDEEYIQGIIDVNSYRPTSEDFTSVFVSGLTLIMPYIVVALFIIFVWKLIKKIFR